MKGNRKTILACILVILILGAGAGIIYSVASNSVTPFSIPVPAAPGINAQTNAKAEIDMSNTGDGYVMIRYLGSTDKKIKVIIKGPSGASYTYNLNSGGNYEVFPLTDGNGQYQIGVYENTSDTQYSTAQSATADVVLSSEFAPFLCPNQYVNYSKDSAVVKKAAELVGGSDDLLTKISAIYEYVVSNLTYDSNLAATVESGYLPDVDAVLASGKGICFDYAAVTTAMLRSQGIPTKLVVGYAGTAYHAWINTYSDETGWVDAIIYFDGEKWNMMDPTFAASGGQSSEVMQYIGDGSNYTPKYVY